MKIYFVAGETSGDNHGAELLRALQARDGSLQFMGRGGPRMRALAGQQVRDWIDEAAVVGLWEVLKRYPFFRREFAGTVTEIAALRPDAVVLIDYPGFNLRLAHALRKRMPGLTIIYYISPQVWAWNQRRVGSMARSIDLMLCIFPFEPQFYKNAGMRALFVGHPMTANFAVGPSRASPDQLRDARLIALFPGSRQREVKKILPIVLSAARKLLRTHPDLHFEIAAASDALAETIRAGIDDNGERFTVLVGQARDLMGRATVGIIASGTATLEAALAHLPFVLVYRVAWLTYLAARLVVKVKYLGMPNVLAGREVVPEFIQHRAQSEKIAREVARLLADTHARTEMLAAFDSISRGLEEGEVNAADVLLAEAGRKSAPVA